MTISSTTGTMEARQSPRARSSFLTMSEAVRNGRTGCCAIDEPLPRKDGQSRSDERTRLMVPLAVGGYCHSVVGDAVHGKGGNQRRHKRGRGDQFADELTLLRIDLAQHGIGVLIVRHGATPLFYQGWRPASAPPAIKVFNRI